MTPKQEKAILDAVSEAIKGLKPRPAVDGTFGQKRLTGKWTKYCQVLLSYAPSEYGWAYVNLDKPSEPKVKVHGPETRQGKRATKWALDRNKRAEKALERKEAREAKAKTEKKA